MQIQEENIEGCLEGISTHIFAILLFQEEEKMIMMFGENADNLVLQRYQMYQYWSIMIGVVLLCQCKVEVPLDLKIQTIGATLVSYAPVLIKYDITGVVVPLQYSLKTFIYSSLIQGSELYDGSRYLFGNINCRSHWFYDRYHLPYL